MDMALVGRLKRRRSSFTPEGVVSEESRSCGSLVSLQLRKWTAHHLQAGKGGSVGEEGGGEGPKEGLPVLLLLALLSLVRGGLRVGRHRPRPLGSRLDQAPRPLLGAS